MTYQLERAAIEKYFSTAWAGLTPLGLDDQEFSPVHESVRLTIHSGIVLQGTIATVSNRIDYVGVAALQIYVNGGLGTAAWRTLAETAQAIFYGAIIDSAGVLITNPANAFVRFSPHDQHPYVAGVNRQSPLTTVTINAPFVRYTFR